MVLFLVVFTLIVGADIVDIRSIGPTLRDIEGCKMRLMFVKVEPSQHFNKGDSRFKMNEKVASTLNGWMKLSQIQLSRNFFNFH